MDEEDDDVHFCLICNKTVSGLAKYINHKKNECSGRKTKIKPGIILQVPSSADGSEKIENQSFPMLNKQNEHLNQSYDRESFGVFTSTTSPSSGYNDQNSFLSACTGTIVSADQAGESRLETPTDDYKKILANTTQSETTTEENIFISTHTNIPDTSNGTLYPHTFSCSLSPIFSTTESVRDTKVSDLTSVTEDYGLLSASVSGNRNNTPVQSETRLKVGVSDLQNAGHIGKGDCEQVDDFFQSLELMSKTDPRADRGSNFNQLPISNILNNLTFSDDEDLGFDFGDDMSLDSLSDEEDGRVPPGGHTGGKWKPGEKPLAYKNNRQRYRGKWQPGERPPQTAIRGRRTPSSRGKNISLIPGHKPKPARKGKRASSNTGNKIYTCNFCNKSFVNRFQYSNHCSSKIHKENVFGTRESLKMEDNKGSLDYTIEKIASDHIVNDFGKRENLKMEDIDGSSDNIVENNASNRVQSTSTKQSNLNETEGVFENFNEEGGVHEEKVVGGNNDDYLDGYETDEYFEEKEVKMSLEEMKTSDTVTAPAEEMQYVEVAVPIHICTVCDKKFHNKYMIARHLLTKFHQNRSLADKKEHEKLIQMYHKIIVRFSPFQCGICRFYFNTNEDFEMHLKSESHQENWVDLFGEIQCTLCQYKTHSREEIYRHIESVDHLERIQKRNRICIIKECHAGCECKFCGLKMHSFERLLRHIKLKHADGQVVTGVQKRVIGVRHKPRCPDCNLQLASYSALTLHMRRRHTEEKPYHCEICCKAFSDKHSHKLHLKSALHNRRKLKQETEDEDIVRTAETETNEEEHVQVDDKLPESKEIQKDTEETSKDEAENTKSAQVQMDDFTHERNLENKVNVDNIQLDKHHDKDVDCIPVKPVTNRRRTKSSRGEAYGYSQKDKKMIKCNHCTFTVEDYDDLRPHYMKEHSAQIRICELCDTVFLSEKAYKLHVLSKEHQSNIELSGENQNGSNQYFQCHVCKKKFTDEKYCKFHTAYQHFHSTTENEVYKQNGYKSVTRDRFADFLRSVENVGYKDPLQCPECDTIIKKSNLMVHLRNHTDERPFQCKVCPKTFKSNYTLRKHLLKHFGCLERDCSICGKHFNKPSSYEEHMELHAMEKASKEKTHICDFCGQAFYVERQLAVHLRRHKKKDLKCDHPGCHWTFAYQHELNAHKRTHSNERKYLCDTCGFAAFEKYHLRRHEKIHNNERKHHCEYCTYKAGNRTHLRRHMRIHIGSKPFKCPYCSFACNTHENIRKHILETKKHEGLKVYPCKFCSFGTNNSKEFRGHLMANHSKESDDGARQMPLSVFTGLFQKEEDIDKPAEGTQILPCKERKIRKKEQNEKDVQSSYDSGNDWAGTKPPEFEKKNRRKRKNDAYKYLIERHNVQDAYELTQEAHDLTMKDRPEDRRMTYTQEVLKDNFGEVSEPYPTGSVIGRETPSPPFIPNNNNIYQRFQGAVPMGVNVPLDLGIRHVQHASHQLQCPPGPAGAFAEQAYIKVNQDEMLQYHDYSTKFGVSRDRDNLESDRNLIIDMNFQAHH